MSALVTAAGAALARHAAAFADPEAAERATLAAALHALDGSRFAAEHGLSPAMSPEAFRDAVPVRRYEDFAPWLGPLIAGEGRAISGEPPVAMELTGGSSGGRKPVPMTEALLGGFREGLMAWLGDLAAHHRIARGRWYFALSPALARPPDPVGAWPVGLPSDLAYFGDHAGAVAPHLLWSPDIAALTDPEAWRTATLALLLGAPDLSFVSVWSPGFLSLLLDALAADPEPALRLLARTDPDRARRLSRGTMTPGAIWPGLALVSAWGDASSARPFAGLGARLPGVTLQGKGLLATEGLFTLPLGGYRDPVPAVLSSVLEFRADSGAVLPMARVEPGDYDLIVTPLGGLPRHSIGDRVRVTGHAAPVHFGSGLPLLRFIGRGGAASDLAGEKLTEAFVLDCLATVGLTGILAARGDPPGYTLLSDAPLPEDTLRRVEDALRRNPHYAYARRLGQLAPLAQRTCPDLPARITAARLAQGHRLSDIKPPVLLPEGRFSALIEG